VDGSVAERRGQCVVDEAVLLEQRQAVEARRRDDHLEVVAAARAVLDAQLGRVGERLLQQALQRFGGHAAMVAAGGSATAPSKRARMARHDPYKAFNFRVEIDGMTAAFTEVSGLDSEVEVIDYREGGEETRTRKLPGLRKYSNIVLKRGITQDAQLWNWHKQVLDGNVHRRNGSVILLDDHGAEQVRWNFVESWPCKYIGPTLNAKSTEAAIETLELAHEGLERV
jgi:phage tail-like protein